MEAKTIKILLLSAFALVAIVLTTCKLGGNSQRVEHVDTDTLFLSQWRREKLDKQKIIVKYEKTIKDLQSVNDSLRVQINVKKVALTAYRFKGRQLQDHLKQVVSQANITPPVKEEIIPLIDSLINENANSDSACDETIIVFEKIISNRDSVIRTQQQVENSLKEVQANEELKSEYLQDQLKQSVKSDRKNKRKNKLLAGALLLLTGFTGSLLIIHANK